VSGGAATTICRSLARRRNLIEGIVTTLALLACPLGMALMMLFMGRGMRDRQGSGERSLDELRAQQQRIAAELERHDAWGDSRARRGIGGGS